MSNPVVIIQARTGSTRLLGKSLLDIGGKPLLQWVIEGAQKIEACNQVIVATTDLAEDNALAKKAEESGADVFRGDSTDVLSRFYKAGKKYNANPIVRICADSPLIEPEATSMLLDKHIKGNSDLTFVDYPAILGALGEILSFNALDKAHNESTEDFQKEHVSPYIHQHPKNFKITKVDMPTVFQKNYRLTIDTAEDLKMMRRLFEKIQEEGLEINFRNAVTVLDDNSEIADINSSIKQRGWK